jgi:adenylosuccinate synthase
VILRYAARVSGFTELALTKLDILSGFDELKIAVAYDLDGCRIDYPPSTLHDLERVQPVYETLPGWSEDIGSVRRAEDLPQAARDYVRRIGEVCDTLVHAVGVGPERDQVIHLG